MLVPSGISGRLPALQTAKTCVAGRGYDNRVFSVLRSGFDFDSSCVVCRERMLAIPSGSWVCKTTMEKI